MEDVKGMRMMEVEVGCWIMVAQSPILNIMYGKFYFLKKKIS